MTPDTQSIECNATLLALGPVLSHTLDNPIDDPAYADRVALTAAIKRVNLDDDDQDDAGVDEEEDDEVNEEDDEDEDGEEDEFESDDEDDEDDDTLDDEEDEIDEDDDVDEDENDDDIKLI